LFSLKGTLTSRLDLRIALDMMMAPLWRSRAPL
jgi:hypothetical protein